MKSMKLGEAKKLRETEPVENSNDLIQRIYPKRLRKFYDELDFWEPGLGVAYSFFKRMESSKLILPNFQSGDLVLISMYIGMHFYINLAKLTRYPENERGLVDCRQEVDNNYFRTMLGLGKSSEDDDLILSFITSFTSWLKSRGSYECVWGKLEYVDNYSVRLVNESSSESHVLSHEEFEQYLDEVEFFMVSKELAEKHAAILDQKRKENEENPENEVVLVETDDDHLFYLVYSDLVGCTQSDFELIRKTHIPSWQRFMREQYYYSLMRSGRDQSGEIFNVNDFVLQDQIEYIGLEDHPEIVEAINQEFKSWLERRQRLELKYHTIEYKGDGKYIIVFTGKDD